MLAQAEKYLNKAKKLKSDKETKHVNVTKTDKGSEVAFMVNDVAFANKKSLLDEYDILCDNQATINIFRNKDMLTNIKRTRDPISVGGVGGILEVDQIGESAWLWQGLLQPRLYRSHPMFPWPGSEKYDYFRLKE